LGHVRRVVESAQRQATYEDLTSMSAC
jgi:hypothetical protein